MSEALMIDKYPFMDFQGRLQGTPEKNSVPFVLVPTEQVTLTEITVPGKRKADWMQALPFMLEEMLAQPVEQLFFAILNRETSGKTQVAVVEKQRMANWVEELKAHNLSDAQLVPDCFAVPETEGWTQCDIEERFVYRTGTYSGFAGERSWGSQLYEMAKLSQPGLLMNICSADSPLTMMDLDFKSLGLRQGVFQPVKQSQSPFKRWMWPIVAIGLIFFVYLLGMVIKTAEMNQQKLTYEQETVALFKQMFPETKRIVNIRAQTKSKLSGVANQTIEPGMAQLVLEMEKDIRPLIEAETIRISEAKWYKQHLKIKLSAANVGILQQLADTLKQRYRVELQLNNLSGKDPKAKVEGELDVSRN